jgi:hypothetical protein
MGKIIFRFAIIISFILYLFSCKEEANFKYNIDNLVEVYWGIPNIIDINPGIRTPEITSPTVFHKNGLVEIGSSETYYWRIYNSRSIIIDNKSEIWQILKLTTDTLHVSISQYPTNDFIMECIYTPVK